MSLGIGGMGWVTPLGSGVAAVWARLMGGDSAQDETITGPVERRAYIVYPVPQSALAELPAHPRLRRSSNISRFAVAAGLAAIKDAGLEISPELAARSAVVFAISNGGVIYTKRFYQDIVATGAQAASPLLFPETVFNAPASHLAAILGITGASYTLVGDGAVGLLALKMAEDLMQNEALDYCLVVAAEEADWLLCDAYRKWRLMRTTTPIEPFSDSRRGMILSEGAGAVLVSRNAKVDLDQIWISPDFRHQREAAERVAQVFERLNGPAKADVVIASANGTFVDDAEKDAIAAHCPATCVYSLKPAMGEGVAAAGLWQVICAVQGLRTQQLPPMLHGPPTSALNFSSGRAKHDDFATALVSTCGLNQQAAGARLRLAN